MTDRRPAAAPRPRRGVAALTAALALVVVLVSGCAALPTSGTPEHAKTPPPPGGGISQCCGLFVEPPQPGWSPSTVVSNFLLASSKSANNYQAARQYLTQSASKAWHPGPQVVILSGTPSVIPLGHVNGPGGTTSTQVEANGPELATLNSSGQYIQAASGKQTPHEVFTLQIQKGVYKINTLPPGHESALLLTSALFHLVYAPRDLYYYGQRNEKLVPDPVYVPIQGANLVDTLVRDLRRSPAGTLDGAARTSVPAQAHVTGVEVFPGPSGGRTAIVNIALPHGTRADIPKMVAQLVCTLTSPAFSPPLFRAVRVKINGRLWQPRGRPLNLATYQGLIPGWGRSDTGVYYLTPAGSIRTLLPAAHRGNVLAKGASGGEPSLSQVAVSPNGAHLAGLGGPATTVYTGTLGSSAKPAELRSQVTGSFSTLSWDGDNVLWVVGRTKQLQGVSDRQGIFELPHGQRSGLLPVGHPHLAGPVTGLRVAPDGDRVALIIGSGASAQVWLAAIVRGPTGGFRITRPVALGGQGVTGVLTGVKAITWYDEDHLLAVAGSGLSTRLWEVPVDGDTPASLGGRELGVTSVTAAGPLNPIYLGLADRQLIRVAGLNQLLQEITAGQAPAYPG
jgi:hypothetical protein